MIVIIIIGIVYTLALANFKTPKQNRQKLSLKNLTSVMKSFSHKKSVEFLCLNECRQCIMLVDGKKEASYDNFFTTKPKIYRFSQTQGLTPVHPGIYFDKDAVAHNICFSVNINNKNIPSDIIVAYKHKVYDIGNVIGGTKIYNSLDAYTSGQNSLRQAVLNGI